MDDSVQKRDFIFLYTMKISRLSEFQDRFVYPTFGANHQAFIDSFLTI